LLKSELSNITIDSGIVIVVRPELPNAFIPIDDKSVGNVIDARAVHPLKANTPIYDKVFGKVIDDRDVHSLNV